MEIEYYNLYTHFVFTTLNRSPVIVEPIRERIEKYMTGIVNNLGSKMYAIYANPDHVHFLASRTPKLSEELLASTIEKSTEHFIRENGLIDENFRWQKTCSAFSVSKSDVDKVCKYIMNQPHHHKKVTFTEEYNAMLKYHQTGLRWLPTK